MVSNQSFVNNMEWTAEHRAFVVEFYFRLGGSTVGALRKFRAHFKINRNVSLPSRKTVKRWVAKFRSSGSTGAKRRVSPSKVRTPESVEKVKISIERSPMRSASKHALALGMSDRTVRRILHRDLNFHPYKVAVVQELKSQDYRNRERLCKEILREVSPQDCTILTDEAHFHLVAHPNKQNWRYWAEDNPLIIHEQPLHCERVTVWCGIGPMGVWGPYFFEEDGKNVSVTSDRYVKMLQDFVRPKHLELENVGRIWFQQDGATAHTARKSMDCLKEIFGDRVISLRGNVGWPARSPDLSPCDFFLWGYLKAKVYEHRPTTIPALKEAIVREIAAIPREMINNVMRTFRSRLQHCVSCGGGHLKGEVFKK